MRKVFQIPLVLNLKVIKLLTNIFALSLVVEAVGDVEVVVRRVRVRGRVRGRRPPRRRGSLRRQARHAAAHRRLELRRRRELLEGRRVALREVQLGLHHGGGRQRPRRLGVAPRLGGVRVHVVVDVLLHLGLGGEAAPAVGHGAAEGPVALVRARVLVEDGLLPEVLAALRTLVRLLARVDAKVLVEYRPLPEKSRAIYASVWLFVCVNAQVLG